MHQFVTVTLLFVSLISTIASHATADDVASPSAAPESEAATTVEWKDLIPTGWERPILAPAPGEEHDHHVDEQSLNAELGGSTIKLPGYMKPVKFDGREVSEFLFVPYLEQHVKRHMHHDANQMVYVELASPVEINNPYIPYWVTGVISLKRIETNDGPTGYTMSEAQLEPYEF